MIVRRPAAAEFPAWAGMRRRLWPDEDADELARELPELVRRDPLYFAFVAEDEAGRLVGFAEIAVRSYAEGAPPGPAAYLEGIWVEPDRRRRGIARAMLGAAEQWARSAGLRHFGSDAAIDNEASRLWHLAAGFAEVERLVVFGKRLR
jgi:aminoglycoside 6'-N-acetyltransferase I